jgi:hypothetical protein
MRNEKLLIHLVDERVCSFRGLHLLGSFGGKLDGDSNGNDSRDRRETYTENCEVDSPEYWTRL